jgi:hypothetical protein
MSRSSTSFAALPDFSRSGTPPSRVDWSRSSVFRSTVKSNGSPAVSSLRSASLWVWLLEHVIVIDEGRIITDQDADSRRSPATTVAGPRRAVEAFAGAHEVLARDGLDGLLSVTVQSLTSRENLGARAAGLELRPVSLQQLIDRRTAWSRPSSSSGLSCSAVQPFLPSPHAGRQSVISSYTPGWWALSPGASCRPR